MSVPGDLGQLGAHRLICGESTLADVVRSLLGDRDDERIDCRWGFVVTETEADAVAAGR